MWNQKGEAFDSKNKFFLEKKLLSYAVWYNGIG